MPRRESCTGPGALFRQFLPAWMTPLYHTTLDQPTMGLWMLGGGRRCHAIDLNGQKESSQREQSASHYRS